MSIYCVKCKAKTETTDVQNVLSANGRPMHKGICVVCGKNKSQFVAGTTSPVGAARGRTRSASERGGDLVSSLNKVTRKKSNYHGQRSPGRCTYLDILLQVLVLD